MMKEVILLSTLDFLFEIFEIVIMVKTGFAGVALFWSLRFISYTLERPLEMGCKQAAIRAIFSQRPVFADFPRR